MSPCMCCGSTTEHRLPVDCPWAPKHVIGQVVCQGCTRRTDLTQEQIEERIAENLRKAAN